MDLMEEQLTRNELIEWYHSTMVRLVQIARLTANKYTRSKVRKAMPKEFAYIMEELITERRTQDKKVLCGTDSGDDHYDWKGPAVYCGNGASDSEIVYRSSSCDRRYL